MQNATINFLRIDSPRIFIVAFVALLNFPFFASAYRPQDTLIFNECLWNQAIFEDAECSDLFHHYPPYTGPGDMEAVSQDLRIGSFNIYRLGSRESEYKDIDLVALIIEERWDLVALSEIQATNSKKLKYNIQAVRAYDDSSIDIEQFYQSYETPGYLELLLKLQELDGSWGLILAPAAQGYSNELLGFLYRASQVNPISSPYCQNNMDEFIDSFAVYKEFDASDDSGIHDSFDSGPIHGEFSEPESSSFACLMSFKGTDESPIIEEIFSRVPFVGRFRSGQYDFSLVNFHARWNPPGRVDGRCLGSCDIYTEFITEILGTEEGTQLEVPRFFESFVTTQEMQEIIELDRDDDVILAGDFNLEGPDDSTQALWEKVHSNLPGSQLYIEEPTTLRPSPMGELASNYDHFLFTPSESQDGESQCYEESIAAVDFTSMDFEFADFFEYYYDPDNFDEIVTNYLSTQVYNRYRVFNGVAYPKWNVTTEEWTAFIESYPELSESKLLKKYQSVIRRSATDCFDEETPRDKSTFESAIAMKFLCKVLLHSPYSTMHAYIDPEENRIYESLLSDHLPIEMSCRTDEDFNEMVEDIESE